MKDMAVFGSDSAEYSYSLPDGNEATTHCWDTNGSNYRIFFPISLEDCFAHVFMNNFFYEDNIVSLFVDPQRSINVFYHPFISEFTATLYKNGIDGLLKPAKNSMLFLQRLYNPIFDISGGIFITNGCLANANPVFSDTNGLRGNPYEKITFDLDKPYALYNWELFFHIPLLIANQLYINQQFEEAMRWFHCIFDPLDLPSKEMPDMVKENQPWQVSPFCFGCLSRESMEELMEDLAKNPANNAIAKQIDRWRVDPFKPHLLAKW
jgi:hypothetical protein